MTRELGRRLSALEGEAGMTGRTRVIFRWADDSRSVPAEGFGLTVVMRWQRQEVSDVA